MSLPESPNSTASPPERRHFRVTSLWPRRRHVRPPPTPRGDPDTQSPGMTCLGVGGEGRAWPYRSWGHCARSCPGSPSCRNKTTSGGTAGPLSSGTLVSSPPPTRKRTTLTGVDWTFPLFLALREKQQEALWKVSRFAVGSGGFQLFVFSSSRTLEKNEIFHQGP